MSDVLPDFKVPNPKAKLVVKVDHMKLPVDQEAIFIELVGARFNTKTRDVQFVSRDFANVNANRNRVFDLFDECLSKSAELAEKMKHATK